MGGYGSGRRYGAYMKERVEDCLSLNVNKLVRDGLIFRARAWGTLRWRNRCTGREEAMARFLLQPFGESGLIFRLLYTVNVRGERQEVDEPIRMQTTHPHFGGIRWWLSCPLRERGVLCGRRVGKLYLPPGAIHFGCRHCYDLTYMSCQESHRSDGLYRFVAGNLGTTPGVVKQLLREQSRFSGR